MAKLSYKPEKYVLALLLLALVAIALGYTLLDDRSVSEVEPNQTAETIRGPQRSEAVSKQASVPTANATPGTEAVPSNNSEAVEESSLRLVDSSGDGVAGLRVTLVSSDEDRRGPFKLISDDFGVVRLPLGVGVPVELCLPDSYLFGPTVGGFLDARKSSKAFVTASDLQLVVVPCITVEVEVRYEDGNPYLGEAFINWEGLTAKTFMLDGANPLRFSTGLRGLKVGDIRITAKSRKPGYGNFNGHPMSMGQDGSVWRLEAVLESDTSTLGHGLVVLDLSQADSQASFSVGVRSKIDAVRKVSVGQRGVGGGSRWLSELLPPGEYQVTVVEGAGGVKYFDQEQPVFAAKYVGTVTVSSGIESIVVPVLQRTGSVMLRVCNEDGVPLSRAVVGLSGAAMVSWQDIDKQAPGTARAGFMPRSIGDAGGKVVLHGLECNEQHLSISAKGFETSEIKVTPTSERVTDYGTVYLKSARGKISITIRRTDDVETASYTVYLLQTGGRIVRPRFEVTGSYLEIDNLDFGRYTVSVKPKSKNDDVSRSQNIRLTKDDTEAHLIFDVQPR